MLYQLTGPAGPRRSCIALVTTPAHDQPRTDGRTGPIPLAEPVGGPARPGPPPTPARLYDYYLGGKDNFAADRAAAERIREVFPALSDAAWANRGFHGRAAAWMARGGIRQFIDVGAGLPTMDNTHQVVQRIAPGARVVYADNDPQVVCHARARLAGGPGVAAVHADVRRPEALLACRKLRALLDLSQPVGLLVTGVMHFVPDADDPWDLITRLTSGLAPGSYLALSHGTADGIPPIATGVATDVYARATERLYPRPRAQVAGFFHGLQVLPPYPGSAPRLCYAGEWGCEDPVLADSDGSRALYCAVARRPARFP